MEIHALRLRVICHEGDDVSVRLPHRVHFAAAADIGLSNPMLGQKSGTKRLKNAYCTNLVAITDLPWLLKWSEYGEAASNGEKSVLIELRSGVASVLSAISVALDARRYPLCECVLAIPCDSHVSSIFLRTSQWYDPLSTPRPGRKLRTLAADTG